jgi:hypothetical protein
MSHYGYSSYRGVHPDHAKRSWSSCFPGFNLYNIWNLADATGKRHAGGYSAAFLIRRQTA